MSHTAAITDIESLCRRYSYSGCEPGTHALAYKVLSLMQRHGVLGGLPVTRFATPTPTTMDQSPERTDAHAQKEKGCGEQ